MSQPNTPLPEYTAADPEAFRRLVSALPRMKKGKRAAAMKALAAYGPAAVEPLLKGLKDSRASVRIAAAKALGQIGDSRALEGLTRVAEDRRWPVAKAAIAALVRLGEVSGPECLFAALEHSRMEVRVAAAEALGRMGDPRAVGPLVAALQRSQGGSARRQAAIGAALGLGVILLACAFFLDSHFKQHYIFALIYVGIYYLTRIRSQSRWVRAISEALARIAEQNPTPELRNALPELRAISVDLFQQHHATQVATRQVAARIEAATAELKHLPVAAAPPGTDRSVLPLPAHSRTPPAAELPRVVTEGEGAP